MISLAIEQSTDTCSVALLSGKALIEEHTWKATRDASRGLFHFVPAMLENNGMDFKDIDLYTVGLGPGGYTGLRIATSAAMAYAMPGKTPCHGLSSGHALAARIHAEHECDSVTVVGDARRNHLWFGVFDISEEYPVQRGAWQLVEPTHLTEHLPERSTIVSPDYERIDSILKEATHAAKLCLVEQKSVPTASALGAVAAERVARGQSSEELVPIYMHPPVAAR